MIIPKWFRTGREDLVYKNLKSLYELKQVEKLWNKILIKIFWKIGFVPTNANPCIFAYQKSNVFIIIEVYVDNLAFIPKSQIELDWLKR